MTIEQLYKNYFSYNNTLGHVSKDAEKAFLLLTQTHWYSLLAEFDPLTAEAMPLPLSEVLRKTHRQETWFPMSSLYLPMAYRRSPE